MQKSNKTHVSSFFQLAVFLAVSCVLLVVFYYPFVFFRAYEQPPVLHPYAATDKEIDLIYAGMTVHHFMETNFIQNKVDIDATLWFMYDPKKVSREKIIQFSFDESTYEKIQSSYSEKDGLEIALFDVQVHAKMDFNFKEYPLDEHRIWFRLKNDSLPIEKYHFKVSPQAFMLGERAKISNCMSQNMHISSGFVTQKFVTEGQPVREVHSSRVLFSFDCNPVDMRHFLNIFLPLYLIFFITLFSFSFVYAEHVTDVPGIAAASVPALFAYRFVIESISPNVSYFMMSDYLFFLYLVLSLLAFISISWALNYSVYAKKMIILSLYGLMLFGCIAIVYLV